MIKYFNILTALVLLAASCKKENAYDKIPATGAVKIEPWIRYEQLLAGINTANEAPGLHRLVEAHQEFSLVYFLRVINDSYKPDTSFARIFDLYAKSPVIRDLKDTLPKVFGDLRPEEKAYAEAFARLSTLLSGTVVPRVYTCLTEFGVGVFSTSDTIMGLSLDMYFGSGNKYYNTETWPVYIQRTMNRENIVSNLLKNYIRNSVLPQVEPRTLLDHMIDQGKEVYLLRRLIRPEQDTLIYDYSKEQLQFCRDNEKQMWAYFLAEKLIYSDQYKKIQKFVTPAPSSPGMPPAAPGRTSAYLGGQIIEAYMERHPQMDVRKMLANTDSQRILEEARYKP